MTEKYIKLLEEENDQLRERIVIAEEESESVWALLDQVKEAIKGNISFTINKDFNTLNEDCSGQLFMTGKKKLAEFFAKIENIEDFYHKIVEMIEDGR